MGAGIIAALTRKRANAGFNPETSVTSAGIWCWLEAGADCEFSSGTPATDGQTIQYWRDRSSNGNDWSQATSGDRPTYTANGGAEYSNGPVVSWAGSAGAEVLDGPNMSALTAGHGFILFDRNADPPGASGDAGLWRIGSSALPAYVPLTDGNIYESFGCVGRAATGNPTPSFTSPRIYSAHSATADFGIKIDGASHYTSAAQTVGFAVAPTLGGTEAGANKFLLGRIRALIIYDGKLSPDDETAVIAYLDALRA